MDGSQSQTGRQTASARHRRTIRLLAALLCAACAVVYALIGSGTITIGPALADGTTGMLMFGIPASLLYAIGAGLLLMTDRRRLWVLGAALQVFVVLAYVSVAEKRDPPYEMWGILLKLAQVVILVSLVYLAVQPPSVDGAEVGTKNSSRGNAAA